MPKTAVNRAVANRVAMIADRFFEIDITALERFLIFICGVGCVDDFKERNFGVKALPGRAGECRQKLILFRNRTHIEILTGKQRKLQVLRGIAGRLMTAYPFFPVKCAKTGVMRSIFSRFVSGVQWA